MGAVQGLGTCVWDLRGRRGVERGRGEAVDVMSCLRVELSYFAVITFNEGTCVLE